MCLHVRDQKVFDDEKYDRSEWREKSRSKAISNAHGHFDSWALWNEVKALELCSGNRITSIVVHVSVGSREMQHEICIQLGVLNESLKHNTSPIWVV